MNLESTAGKRPTLTGAVVVITGASSGIGRASALAFADRGCHLVLAARRHQALLDVARQCELRGVETHVMVTDVTSRGDLERLLEGTLERFGRIDTWINNAGTTLFGRLYEGDFDAHRRVLETNLLAPMYAARLVIPVFRHQGHGVIINVGSVLSQVGQAFVPAYAISKFGLRGLSEALRSDVADSPDIHVCTVLPYAVDTPHFEEGANLVGQRPYAMQPVQPPERVAQAPDCDGSGMDQVSSKSTTPFPRVFPGRRPHVERQRRSIWVARPARLADRKPQRTPG